MQRRDFFKKLTSAVAVGAALPVMGFAAETKPKGPNAFTYAQALEAITGGKTPVKSDKIHLKVPEIAENGAVVPVTVEVDSPMTADDYVKAIHIFATKNSNVRCLDTYLTPANGKAMLATRVKLGQTQEVAALVELSNGDFLVASQSVKVTIGGCG
ncbi:thiosulfate oxidation carrier protein SoxY [Sulfurimonas sp. C5]|uniref:thiosulfate oxidation carrier protein SoxY n=1 Tax=Sulfurimonas sp. C5 TaxID=3036947 RepID=UPI0024540213|nr:thiosulfate oxidation carrier protein SoxY [Sulfurimonas sp. C5]MDH4944469.1 thiosulfate oxidation carrier protein SoxY [Sulfurimonas sp. C5]